MSQVGITFSAQNLLAIEAKTRIHTGVDISWCHRRAETRPTRAGIEFVLRPEQGIPAADTTINSGPVIVPVSVPERELGSSLTGNGVFLRRELPAPLDVGQNKLTNPANRLADSVLRE
jgi:hypothetical protein